MYSVSFLASNARRASASVASSFCVIRFPEASVRMSRASSLDPKRLATTSQTSFWSLSDLNLKRSMSFCGLMWPLMATGTSGWAAPRVFSTPRITA